jgi:hypothetical protein
VALRLLISVSMLSISDWWSGDWGLVALRLIRRGSDGVRALPALARYALAAPTIAGELSQLELQA